MKKLIIAGVGAQGSTIAKRMDGHPDVSEIICADYDIQAARKLSDSLQKATAMQLDAREVKEVIKASEGCDPIVNGLPLEYDLNVMEAALAVNASYLDMAGPMEDIGFVESYKLIFSKWHKQFQGKGNNYCRNSGERTQAFPITGRSTDGYISIQNYSGSH